MSPKGNRIGIVTVSGGVGVLMADDAIEHGLDVVEMPAAAQAAMKELVPFAGPRNPLDITGQVANDWTLLERAIDIMLGTGRYDMLATFHRSGRPVAENGRVRTARLSARIRARVSGRDLGVLLRAVQPEIAQGCRGRRQHARSRIRRGWSVRSAPWRSRRHAARSA